MQTDSQTTTLSVARDSIAYLHQGIDLLTTLSDQEYVATMPPVYTSTVGAHFRHILDHFRCLTAGLQSGRVDYDCRARDPLLESDRAAAILELRSVIGDVAALRESQRGLPLEVRMDCGGDGSDWSTASLARELQFLISHTIHHYALIAAILNHAGCSLPAGFGVSPSTLLFEKTLKAQAR